MSIADYTVCDMVNPEGAEVPPHRGARRLHRLAAVRRLQGVSLREAARVLNLDASQVKQQEEATSDLPLSTLYKWQRLLEVPVAELLVEDDAPLSAPVLKRAQLVRMMKSVLSILEQSSQSVVRRMAENLVGQLLEAMPELKGVNAWNEVGQRRRLTELGRAAERGHALSNLFPRECGPE